MKSRMKVKALIVALVTILAVSGSSAQESTTKKKSPRRPQQTKYLKTGGERKLEVVYKNIGGRDLKLDLYYPTTERSKNVPVIVFTHGGGWAAGSRYKAATGSFALVFQRLIKEGFAVVPVTYRLAKKDSNVALRDCVIDCKDAIRYLAKHSESLGIDPLRIGVMGDSAGGHIAQMLLLASHKAPCKHPCGASWLERASKL